jgi:hypothetical protein
MRVVLLALPFLLAASARAQGSEAGGYEPELTRILRAVVGADGRVDYRALGTTHRAAFGRVRAAVEGYDAARLRSDDAKLAFLLNAYNVHVLARVLAHPPATHLERDGLFEAFFRAPVTVAGVELSLDEIERDLLRKEFERTRPRRIPALPPALTPAGVDPRIHAGLNCAALSCPPLRRTAFTAQNVDAELDAAMRAWAGSDRFARVRGGRVTLSRLLDWYGEDWERDGRALGDVLLAAMSPRRAGFATLRALLAGITAAELRARVEADPALDFAYDWTVNRR